MIDVVAETLRSENQVGSLFVIQRAEIVAQRLPDGVVIVRTRK